jgi:hypothetical protein
MCIQAPIDDREGSINLAFALGVQRCSVACGILFRLYDLLFRPAKDVQETV